MRSRDETLGSDDPKEPVGEPLELADAAFLRDELGNREIRAAIHPEPGIPGAETHLVLVASRDADRARRVRTEILSAEAPPVGRSRSRSGRLGPVAAGLLGVFTGLRVGTHFHGRLLAIALSIVLGLTAFLTVSQLGNRGIGGNSHGG